MGERKHSIFVTDSESLVGEGLKAMVSRRLNRLEWREFEALLDAIRSKFLLMTEGRAHSGRTDIPITGKSY
jgi:hypothetical protein